MDKKIFETYRGYVMSQETDSNDHMNVQFYTTKFDQATGQLLTLLGLDLGELKLQNWGFAYVEMCTKYLKELLEDHAVHVESTVLDCTDKVVTIRHQMYNTFSNDVAAESTAKFVILDKMSRRAIVLPEGIKEKLVACKI